MLPNSANVAQLLAQLGNRGRLAGLQMDEFDPKDEKTLQADVAQMDFGVKLSGSYHEVGMFLDSISRMDRIVNVTTLEMTNPEPKNQRVVVRCQLQMTTYRFVPENERKKSAKKKKKRKT